jgi:hypothetical protein
MARAGIDLKLAPHESVLVELIHRDGHVPEIESFRC